MEERTLSEHISYPAEILDVTRMNRVFRHRLRNLCAGMKMAIEAIALQAAPSHTGIAESCSLMAEEMDDLLRFTKRMDLLFSELPPAEPLPLLRVLEWAPRFVASRSPLCPFTVTGDSNDVVLAKGSWWLEVVRELLTNAVEASDGDRDRLVSLSCRISPQLRLEVLNTGATWPPSIPSAPPEPFRTTHARHDGIGLAIVHRVCLAMGAVLELRTDTPDTVVVAVKGSGRETV